MEGPSLQILKEELAKFHGRKVLSVKGNTKQPKERLKGRKLARIETWGKVLFLFFSTDIVTKTHFLMFGSYRIDEPRPNRQPRLELRFANGTIYFYACSIQFDAEKYFRSLDPKVNLMSSAWDETHVLELMKNKTDAPLCDLFLEQSIFAGSGNIVKNEVLFNIRCHPLTKLSEIPRKDWLKLAQAVHDYCWNFYTWKKKFELRKHWQVYQQSKCPLCDTKLVRKNLGKFSRRTFFCPRHQATTPTWKKLTLHPVLPIKNDPSSLELPFDH